MRKLFSFLLMISLILVGTAASADTIYLKNGSILKGKVASFAEDQFIVLLDTGGGKHMSRAMIYTGDVSRIEFDSAPALSAGDPASSAVKEVASNAQPSEPPPAEKPSSEPEPVKTDDSTERDKSTEKSPEKPPEKSSEKSSSENSEERDKSPEKSSEKSSRETAPPDPEPKRDPEPPPVEKVEKATETASAPPVESPVRKPTGVVRTQTVDVSAKRDWTSTGLIVKRGDRVTITASGTVTLDPAGERTSGPEGMELSDGRKLMPDHPTGALIAVIGADNDEFIFVGGTSEFIATRDGLLFLSINEGVLSDNTGSYKAVIEIETQRPGR